jgi:hypothetical protein
VRDRLVYFYAWMQRRWLPAVVPIGRPAMLKRLRAVFRTPLGRRVEHAGYVFAAAFAVTAYGNRDHLLHAHGLDGLKSAAYAVVAAAAYAGLSALRPLLPTPPPTPTPSPSPPPSPPPADAAVKPDGQTG